MRRTLLTMTLATLTGLLPGWAMADRDDDDHRGPAKSQSAKLSPRPFFLVNDMTDSPLKQRLLACTKRESFITWTLERSGILGIFTDWPATVTFYANCMGLK